MTDQLQHTRSRRPYPRDEALRRDLPGPSWVFVLGWPVWTVYAAGLFVRRHPYATVAGALAGLVWWLAGPLWVGVLVCAAGLVLAVWRVTDRDTFDVVTRRPAVQWRAWWVYRRRWRAAMRAAGLDDAATGWVPSLLRVSYAGPGVDRLHVRSMFGQTSVQWLDSAGRLAAMFGARSVVMRLGPRGTVWLDITRGAVRSVERPANRPGTRVPVTVSEAHTAALTAARPAISEGGSDVRSSA